MAFRGQECEDWRLESSAERRLRYSLTDTDVITDDLFIDYHRDTLLKTGTLKNYHKRKGDYLDELELLADLQHHGAATCLIDFTRNAFVALWFACEQSSRDGKVFIIDTADVSDFRAIASKDIKGNTVEDILRFETLHRIPTRERTAQYPPVPPPDGPKFWHWIPAHMSERITAQGSLFIFGLPSVGKPISKEIVVASESKVQIRKELAELYDIREESLFPDFVGFARTQRHDAPIGMPDPIEYRNRGIEAHQNKDYNLAIRLYNKAMEIEPDSAIVYLVRGFAYEELGFPYLAIQDYTQALALEPENATAYLSRAVLYLENGKFAQAIQDSDSAIAYQVDNYPAYLNRANAYSSLGDFVRAFDDYDKVLELDPNNPAVYSRRGSAYFAKGDDDLAIQEFNMALGLDPNSADAYFGRGLAYYRKDELDRAAQDFSRATSIAPDDADPYFARALVWLRLSEWASARLDLTAAKSEGFDIAEVFCRLYKSVEGFEQKYNVKLTEDIVSMLTT